MTTRGAAGAAAGRCARQDRRCPRARPPHRLPQSRRVAPAAQRQPSASVPPRRRPLGAEDARGGPGGVRGRSGGRGGAHLDRRYLSSSGRRGMCGTLRVRAAPRDRACARAAPGSGLQTRWRGAGCGERPPSWGLFLWHRVRSGGLGRPWPCRRSSPSGAGVLVAPARNACGPDSALRALSALALTAITGKLRAGENALPAKP